MTPAATATPTSAAPVATTPTDGARNPSRDAPITPPPLSLVPLRISNGARAGERLPARLKILNWGENPSRQGPVRVGARTLRDLAARQRELGFEEVAIDFEHNTVPGSPEFERTEEPRRVAAYGAPRVIAGEGLYLEDLRWTPAGHAEALNFADLSPAVGLDEAREVIFVHSVALTRNGAVEGLTFFRAAPERFCETMIMNQPDPPTGPPPAAVAESFTVADLATALGLPASAPKADVLGRLKSFTADLAPAAADFAAWSVRLAAVERAAVAGDTARAENPDPPSLATFQGQVTGLSARIERLEQELKQRDTAAVEAEKTALLRRFAVEGKVPLDPEGRPYRDDQLRALDVPTLQLLHANTPATVPLHARGRRPVETRDGGDLKGLDRVIAVFQARRETGGLARVM